MRCNSWKWFLLLRREIMRIKTLLVQTNRSTGARNGATVGERLHEIINIQFFITQSNTDGSIKWERRGGKVRAIHSAWSLLHLCSQQQKLIFGEMIYVIIRNVGLRSFTCIDFQSQFHGNVNKSTVVFRCFLIEMQMQVCTWNWRLMQHTTEHFSRFQKGKSNPIAITFPSPAYCRRKITAKPLAFRSQT